MAAWGSASRCRRHLPCRSPNTALPRYGFPSRYALLVSINGNNSDESVESCEATSGQALRSSIDARVVRCLASVALPSSQATIAIRVNLSVYRCNAK